MIGASRGRLRPSQAVSASAAQARWPVQGRRDGLAPRLRRHPRSRPISHQASTAPRPSRGCRRATSSRPARDARSRRARSTAATSSSSVSALTTCPHSQLITFVISASLGRVRDIVQRAACEYLGETLASAETRIQLCGRLVVRLGEQRVEGDLPGRQGRLLFVYLATHRQRPAGRDELVDALWPTHAPETANASLSALVSKLRRALGAETIEGRGELRLSLPADAWVDREAASEALHRAESAAARSAWDETWSPARVAQHIGARGFLPGEDAPWIDEARRELEELYLRALELAGRASLELGGTELDTAERAGPNPGRAGAVSGDGPSPPDGRPGRARERSRGASGLRGAAGAAARRARCSAVRRDAGSPRRLLAG